MKNWLPRRSIVCHRSLAPSRSPPPPLPLALSLSISSFLISYYTFFIPLYSLSSSFFLSSLPPFCFCFLVFLLLQFVISFCSLFFSCFNTILSFSSFSFFYLFLAPPFCSLLLLDLFSVFFVYSDHFFFIVESVIPRRRTERMEISGRESVGVLLDHREWYGMLKCHGL